MAASPPCARLRVFASPQSWHGRLACARLRAASLASQSWHGRLACTRPIAVGLVSLLAWPPRLRSAACCWPRLILGIAASTVFGCLLLASPQSWHGHLACALGCMLLASPHPRGWPARLASAQRLGTAASPALGCVLLWPRLAFGTAASPVLGCVLWASPHSWHGRLACARLRVVGLASPLAWPPRLPALGCVLLASPHSWRGRLACARPLAVGLASHSWHGLLAYAWLLVLASPHSRGWPDAWFQLKGLALPPRLRSAACCRLRLSLLARPPRLRSAVCCWPRLTCVVGQHACPRLTRLALPPCLRSAACCWPRLSPLTRPPCLRSAACVGLASLAWLASALGLGSKAWHCRLACARLLAAGLASFLARPPCLRWVACITLIYATWHLTTPSGAERPLL